MNAGEATRKLLGVRYEGKLLDAATWARCAKVLVGEKVEKKRQQNGRFATDNGGGPGRPPRIVEDDYLRTLSEACPLETWRKICERAVRDAEAGDFRARAWLAHHLCPNAVLHRESPFAELEF